MLRKPNLNFFFLLIVVAAVVLIVLVITVFNKRIKKIEKGADAPVENAARVGKLLNA